MSRANDGDCTLMKGLDSDKGPESENIVTYQEFSPFKVLAQGPEEVCKYEKILHTILTDIEATIKKCISGVVRFFRQNIKASLMS